MRGIHEKGKDESIAAESSLKALRIEIVMAMTMGLK